MNYIKRSAGLWLLSLLTGLLSPVAGFAQGSIFGSIQHSDHTVPPDADLVFFGYIRGTDNEIRTNTCVGAGYESGNWYDDFQNYSDEAPGEPFVYNFFDTVSGESGRIPGIIPNNSYEQRDTVLAPAVWPLSPDGLRAVPFIDSGIVLVWQSQSGLTYHVYRRQRPSSGSFFRIDDPTGNLANPGVSDSTFTDTNINGTSSYDYVVIAEDGGGTYSPPSRVVTGSSICTVAGSADLDGDGVADECDNCVATPNPDQIDSNGNSVGDVCETCCGRYTGGYTGNTDCDPEGKMNLADIVILVDRIYLTKKPLCCEASGNVDGDALSKLNLADILKLIDHIYLTKGPTTLCQ